MEDKIVNNDGLQYLNAIQERAGAPLTSLTMENVKKEKWFELYMEGTRFEDLVRWGDAAKELADNGHQFRQGYSNPDTGLTTRRKSFAGKSARTFVL